MLDTPHVSLWNELQKTLDVRDGEQIILGATINATISENVEMSAKERADFGKTFDDVEHSTLPSKIYWRHGTKSNGGRWVRMVLGGPQTPFAPANSPDVNQSWDWA